MHHQYTLGDGDRKVGKGTPVISISSDTCNPRCGMLKKCYAKKAYMLHHWRKIDKRERGMSLRTLLKEVKERIHKTKIRYAMMGDLPGEGDAIDAIAAHTLANGLLVNGNEPFTFTHKEVLDEANPATCNNRKIIAALNKKGFTTNVSADTLEQADQKKALNIGPIAVVVDNFATMPKKTPAGHTLVPCLEQRKGWDKVTCTGTNGTIACGWCLKKDRNFIVAFSSNRKDKA